MNLKVRDEFDNKKNVKLSVQLNQVPTRLRNELEKQEFNPGEIIKTKIILYDHKAFPIPKEEINVKIFNEKKEVIGSFAVITDIENRKRIEKSLRKSEEKYRSLVETTLDVVWELDSNAHFTYVNAKIENLLGYEAKDVIGQSFTTILAKQDIQSAINIFKTLSIHKKPIDVFEFRLIHKNGQEMVFEINAVPVLDSNGVFSGCKHSYFMSKPIYSWLNKEAIRTLFSHEVITIPFSGQLVVFKEFGFKKVNSIFNSLFKIYIINSGKFF